MTKSEAGRKGGNACLAKHGTAHYRMMAYALIAKRGRSYMSEIGQRGGMSYVRKYIAVGGVAQTWTPPPHGWK